MAACPRMSLLAGGKATAFSFLSVSLYLSATLVEEGQVALRGTGPQQKKQASSPRLPRGLWASVSSLVRQREYCFPELFCEG